MGGRQPFQEIQMTKTMAAMLDVPTTVIQHDASDVIWQNEIALDNATGWPVIANAADVGGGLRRSELTERSNTCMKKKTDKIVLFSLWKPDGPCSG